MCAAKTLQLLLHVVFFLGEYPGVVRISDLSWLADIQAFVWPLLIQSHRWHKACLPLTLQPIINPAVRQNAPFAINPLNEALIAATKTTNFVLGHPLPCPALPSPPHPHYPRFSLENKGDGFVHDT